MKYNQADNKIYRNFEKKIIITNLVCSLFQGQQIEVL
jgi:hypothetical protein